MFIKPRQRNLRGRTATDNTEDESENTSNTANVGQEYIPTTTIKPTIKKIEPPKSLLSFGDDEGDTEEFKVNKTRESRRMTKEVKKQQKNDAAETKASLSVEKSATKIMEEIPIIKEEKSTTGEIEIKFKPLQIVGNKSSTNSFVSVDAELHRLRQEIKQSNGLSMDTDDRETADEIFEGNDEDEDNTPMDETQRSVKLMLRSGIIPDSTMIHAARKRRQMARELGVPGDYISLNKNSDNSQRNSAPHRSRLIRDDDNDASDDSEPEDRHIVSMDRNQTRAQNERQKNRDRFLEVEQGSDNEDDDDEFIRFEREQIRKGVSSKLSAKNAINNLASVPSTFQSGQSKLDSNSSLIDPQPMEVEIIRDLPPVELPPVEFDDIRARLRSSLKSISESKEKRRIDFTQINEAFKASKISLENNQVDYPKIEKSYQFYQKCRDYLFLFLECYNEKMVNIIDLEDRWLQLYKQRTKMIINRRQEDYRDQDKEFSTSKAAAFMAGSLPGNDFRTILDQKQQRRATEREARRLRRRKDREQTNEQHFDGMSTDDEENQSDINSFLTQKQEILNEGEHVLDDVSDNYSRCKFVKNIFEQWKSQQSETYIDAYIEACLPKVFSPIIRLEMIDWKPFETSCHVLENYIWYQDLLYFGFDQDRNESEDFGLIPMIIEKVIVPKLTIFIENIYDPLSTKQTNNLVKVIEQIFQTYPSMNDDSTIVQTLLKAIVDRLQQSIDEDIYIPLYPKELIVLGSSNVSTSNSVKAATEFFFRQYWTSVKLLGNITTWSNILSLKTIIDLSVDGLLNRYILMALRSMDLTSPEMVTRCLLLAKCFPIKQWFEMNQKLLNEQTTSTTLPALENFCSFLNQLARQYSDQYFSANEKDKKMYKENIRQIRVIFVHLHALDHALELTNQYEIK